MPTQTVRFYFDGGAKNGSASAGVVAYELDDTGKEGQCILEKAIFIEEGTNNVGEYRALMAAMEAAGKMKYENIEIRGDAKLIVNQVKQIFKCKSPGLLPLLLKSQVILEELTNSGKKVTLKWVDRKNNSHADSLADLALERKTNVEYSHDVVEDDAEWPDAHHARTLVQHSLSIQALVEDPRRSKLKALQETWQKVLDSWAQIHN